MRAPFVAVCLLLLLAFPAAAAHAQQPTDAWTPHPRVFVLSDIGNEPDDQMSLIRLLLYSNELDIQGLVATTSTWQKTATHAETMHALVAAYGKVRPSLMLNAPGWPEAATLASRIATGQTTYGMAGTGTGHDSAGAQLLIAAADHADTPLWVTLWGGASTLAQALIDVRSTRSAADLARFVARLRIVSISDQDDAGPWIRREFPTLFYVVSPSRPDGTAYAYATWTGISGDLYYRNGEGADTTLVTNDWLDQHIRNQGPLGKLYPRFLFIMEGDTPSFLNLIPNGLNSYQRPDWGGWGGRYLFLTPYGETHAVWTQGGDEFTRITSQDTVTGIDGKSHTSDQATIWRWRAAFQNDFAARMHWTVADFAHSNHAPEITLNGHPGIETLTLTARVGEPVTLDATGTHDPDNSGAAPDTAQHLTYRWFQYKEAGATDGNLATLTLSADTGPRTTVTATSPCSPLWLPLLPCKGPGTAHLILAVTDNGTPALTSYRRVVLHVLPAEEQNPTAAVTAEPASAP